MEFGALQCAPKNPNCENCTLSDSCVALQKNQVKLLPLKEKKHKVVKRYFNYLVLQTSDNKTILQQRKGKGIWQNLFEFPLVETTKNVDFRELIQDSSFLKIVDTQGFTLQLLSPDTIVHKLSHQHLNINFWLLKTEDWHKETLSLAQAKALPTPIIIHKFMDVIWDIS